MADNGFRAGRGYIKEDVNAYVIEQGKRLKAAQDELAEVRAELERSKSGGASQKSSEETSRLSGVIEEQKKEIAALRAQLDSKKNAPPSDADLSRALGDVLLVAQKSAATLVSSAKEEAEKITIDAASAATAIRENALTDAAAKAAASASALAERSAKAEAALAAMMSDFTSEFETSIKKLTDAMAASIASGKAKAAKARDEITAPSANQGAKK